MWFGIDLRLTSRCQLCFCLVICRMFGSAEYIYCSHTLQTDTQSQTPTSINTHPLLTLTLAFNFTIMCVDRWLITAHLCSRDVLNNSSSWHVLYADLVFLCKNWSEQQDNRNNIFSLFAHSYLSVVNKLDAPINVDILEKNDFNIVLESKYMCIYTVYIRSRITFVMITRLNIIKSWGRKGAYT